MRGKSWFGIQTFAVLGILAIALLLATPGVSAEGGGEDQIKETGQWQEQALSLPEKAGLKYSNLGSRLDRLVARFEEQETTPEDAAAGASMHQGESVAVTIYLSGSVDDVVAFLEENGGDPRNVGEDYIEAYVPVTLLGRLSEQPGVIRVREIVPPQPGQSAQRIAGHGPAAHLSAAWNQAGYSGQGIKVGIIDTGFEGFRGLMGTELPTTVQARCYTDLGRFTTNLADCENNEEEGDNHGTAVAETVMDIAPEVSLYIAHPRSKGDQQAAADWMVSEGVSVINTSIGWTFDGPGDGTSPFGNSPLKTVDQAVDDGAIWVSLAHNHAKTTWFARAPFLDLDGDRFIEFALFDEVNEMTLEAGDRVVVQLRWADKWGGASTNLDLGIQDNVAGKVVAVSVDPQSGALATTHLKA